MEIVDVDTHGLFPHSNLQIKTLSSDTAVGAVLSLMQKKKWWSNVNHAAAGIVTW
jgi:hypothetical protein